MISVQEYLATSYRPDCDYVDGRVEERNLGEYNHAKLQAQYSEDSVQGLDRPLALLAFDILQRAERYSSQLGQLGSSEAHRLLQVTHSKRQAPLRIRQHLLDGFLAKFQLFQQRQGLVSLIHVGSSGQ